MEQLVSSLLFLAIYFIPFLVALKRRKADRWAILVLNLFLGWTLIGWVIALVWAFKVDKAPAATAVIKPEASTDQDHESVIEEDASSETNNESSEEHKDKDSKLSPGAIIALVIGGLILVGLVASLTQENGEDRNAGKSVQPVATPTPEVIRITAGEILAAYDNNPIRAEAQYKGRIVDVSGIVSDIDKVLGQAYVSLKANKEDFGLITFQCIFKDRAVSQLATLDQDQTVTVRGKVHDKNFLGGVVATDCELSP